MSHPNRERADKILDVAGELLLRMGYRKVAIDDIARAVGIGKGTVYLHWRTKERLFQALMMRESAELTEEILHGLKADAAGILPHRFIPASFVATSRSPLMMAMLKGNADLLGSLGDAALQAQQAAVVERLDELMRERRLVRTDVPNLTYALRATATGFYFVDSLVPENVEEIALDAKAAAMAHVIKAAFEPPGDPDPEAVAAIAAELITALEGIVSSYRNGIYAKDPATVPG